MYWFIVKESSGGGRGGVGGGIRPVCGSLRERRLDGSLPHSQLCGPSTMEEIWLLILQDPSSPHCFSAVSQHLPSSAAARPLPIRTRSAPTMPFRYHPLPLAPWELEEWRQQWRQCRQRQRTQQQLSLQGSPCSQTCRLVMSSDVAVSDK